jgi:uncharacterized protein YkwD
MMKRIMFLGVVNSLLLLSIVVGVFVVQSSWASAQGTHRHKHTVSTKRKHSVSTTSKLAQQLFALINSDRAAQGLPAYHWNATLAKGASAHSKLMAQPSCGLSHQCPGEPNPCQRITNEGISWMACGENAGYTTPTPNAWTAIKVNIEQGMLNEQPPDDGHRLNLLSSVFRQIGVGIYIDARGIIWVTEDFTN